MLEELNVKNFALIKEANIEFNDKLNILTGETGSGKSILIGSINLALGKRASKDFMRNENEDTVVCITFKEKNIDVINKIRNMDFPVEDDGKIIIYRRITKDRNIAKINDVNCTLNRIKEVTEMLIDLYGQHDSEDLRYDNRHIEFIDEYIGKDSIILKKQIEAAYKQVQIKKEAYDSFNMDEKMRLREIDILKFEIEELENAKLIPGEEDDLAVEYKKINNAKNILTTFYTVSNSLRNMNIGDMIKELKSVLKYDDSIENIINDLTNAQSIVSDSIKDIEKKCSYYDIDDEKLYNVENRLNLIRSILAKYDNKVEVALKELVLKKERLEILNDYENKKTIAYTDLEEAKKVLLNDCEKLSELRKKISVEFVKNIKEELKELGFNDVQFDIEFNKKENPTLNGIDDVVFMISLNIGEKLRPLSQVASGGELSRIMLSIKTILSNSVGIETLIFDEIDQGISGITATKVASKLNRIAKNHQVICITHLPQIAAMADYQYKIDKNIEDNRTITNITKLDYDGMINEIGRLIGSNEVLTDSVIANAKELKQNALKEKV